jgi:tRNA G18 (ribose-2'-O)-methylase SpoU
MQGIADSLNVSTAAAIVLYEAVRQRRAAADRGH